MVQHVWNVCLFKARGPGWALMRCVAYTLLLHSQTDVLHKTLPTNIALPVSKHTNCSSACAVCGSARVEPVLLQGSESWLGYDVLCGLHLALARHSRSVPLVAASSRPTSSAWVCLGTGLVCVEQLCVAKEQSRPSRHRLGGACGAGVRAC